MCYFLITLVERDDNLKSFKLYNNLALKSIKNFVSNTEGKCTCLNTYKTFTKTDHILSQKLQEKNFKFCYCISNIHGSW